MTRSELLVLLFRTHGRRSIAVNSRRLSGLTKPQALSGGLGRSLMQETNYKGYLIRYHCTEKWLAMIWSPKADMEPDGQVVTATVEEGAEGLLRRVHARIDREGAGGKGMQP